MNIKVEPNGQLLRLPAAFHTLSLFYLRTQILSAFERKNYLKEEIHPYRSIKPYLLEKYSHISFMGLYNLRKCN